jgi:DNA-binding response OmpR family regulator
MAKVFLIGLEQVTASQIRGVFPPETHSIECKDGIGSASEVPDADIVFAGGERDQSLSLLRQLREAKPALPCVILSRMPETKDWLDALEAGAADYIGAPFDAGQLLRIVAAVQPARRSAAA